MTFASFDSRRGNVPMSEINMVPLIDVMLVLLVIFIVTAPLLTQGVQVDLPKAGAAATDTKPDTIAFTIDVAGNRYWNGTPVSRTDAADRFAEAAQRTPQPEIHLRTDQSAAYRHVAETLADASRAGLTKIGFISEPER